MGYRGGVPREISPHKMIQSLKDREMQLNTWTHETKSFHVIHSQSQQCSWPGSLAGHDWYAPSQGQVEHQTPARAGWRLKCPRPFACSEIVGDFSPWNGFWFRLHVTWTPPILKAPGASRLFFVAGRPISPEGEEGLHYPTSVCQHTSETTLLARPSSHHLQSNPRFQSLNV